MPYREVVNPTTQHRINQFDYPCDWLGTQYPEHDLESAQKCRALLRLGPTQWHPQAANINLAATGQATIVLEGESEPD